MKERFIKFLKNKRLYSKFVRNLEGRSVWAIIQFEKFVTTRKPSEYVIKAFIWYETPQGHQFWCDVETEWLKEIKK